VSIKLVAIHFFISALLHHATPEIGLYFNLDWYGKRGAGHKYLSRNKKSHVTHGFF
jgi:hypothetical protein